MLRDFVTTGHYLHEERARRLAGSPVAPVRPRQRLRRAIGQGLIAIGERLAMAEKSQSLDKAA